MRIIKDTHIDFMGKSRLSGFFSLFLIVAGLVSLTINNGPKRLLPIVGQSPSLR
jgi:hypothetical protein